MKLFPLYFYLWAAYLSKNVINDTFKAGGCKDIFEYSQAPSDGL